VEIKLKPKGSFKLRGRIDRVDRAGDHEYEVWDYPEKNDIRNN